MENKSAFGGGLFMYSVGIDLGGTNIAAGVVDENGRILAKDSVKTMSQRHFSLIVEDMAGLVRTAVEKAGLSLSDVSGIGVGAPGSVDAASGVVLYANNLGFANTPLGAELQKHIPLPVRLCNDANCAVLGETVAGAASGRRNVVMITLGTGVGGGVVIGGRLYEGEYSAGAELGHNVLVVDGALCTCGRRGCWEAYSSATGLIRMTRQAMAKHGDSLMHELCGYSEEKIDGKTAFDAAKAGDEAGIAVVREYVKYLSEGIVDMVNIFRPEIVLVGGGICKEGDFLLDPVREYVRSYAYASGYIPCPEIKAATLGNDAGIIGAATLILRP